MQQDCSIKGCSTKAWAKGLCATHYSRLHRGQSLYAKVKPKETGLTDKERFEKRIIKNEVSGCWIWQGFIASHGYGTFALHGERPMLAHRAAWRIYKGEIPKDQKYKYNTACVAHHCDNRRCVNVEHLFLTGWKGNMQDALAKGLHGYGWVPGSKNGNSKLTEEKVKKILADPRSLEEIGADYGVHAATISRIKLRQTWMHLKGNAVRHVPEPRLGERASNVKLTETEVKAIRASRKSQYALAEEFGVSQPHISALKRGALWGHVTGRLRHHRAKRVE